MVNASLNNVKSSLNHPLSLEARPHLCHTINRKLSKFVIDLWQQSRLFSDDKEQKQNDNDIDC